MPETSHRSPMDTPSAAPRGGAPLGAMRRGGMRRGGTLRGIVVSVAVHGAIAAAILSAAWGVSRRTEELPPVVLVADFEHPAPAAARPTDTRATPTRAETAQTVTQTESQTESPTPADALAERLRALEAGSAANAELDALARRFDALSADAGARGAEADSLPAATPAAGASFAGLVAGNATKVAYVVDASGSMVGRFPAIVDEVERSLLRLEPTQRFTVICFRKDGAVAFEGDPSLRAASRDARASAVRWLRERVVPAGRSSPLEALSMALGSGADCVFLLSTTVTGPASHELDRASMVALVDRLNPRDAASGRRRASIQCIQFLEADPGETLRAIADEHFGPGGYRFIPRSATSLDGARP